MNAALFIATAIFLAGVLVRYHASRIKPNWIYGYRSTRSLQSKKAWVEGNRFCGLLFMILGPVVALVGAVSAYVLHLPNDTVIVSVMVALVLLAFVSIISTELRLKERYGK